MVSCDTWKVSSLGCVRFSHPAICSGAHCLWSFPATMVAYQPAYRSWGVSLGPKPLGRLDSPDKFPGHHYD